MFFYIFKFPDLDLNCRQKTDPDPTLEENCSAPDPSFREPCPDKKNEIGLHLNMIFSYWFKKKYVLFPGFKSHNCKPLGIVQCSSTNVISTRQIAYICSEYMHLSTLGAKSYM